MRRKPFLELVEQLEPSAAVLQALSETVTWCLSLPPRQDRFRSTELHPSALLRIPPLSEIGVDIFLEKTRDSYVRAMESINATRSALITTRSINDATVAGSRGRILRYEPLETVSDGASAASSLGFFDMEDAPPWDIWFLYSAGSIFSWVPEAMIQNAQPGIDAIPVDCIHWCDWQKL